MKEYRAYMVTLGISGVFLRINKTLKMKESVYA